MAKAEKLSFHHYLVLNRWVKSLFGEAGNFDDLVVSLKNENLPEGINEQGQSHFFEVFDTPYKRSQLSEFLQDRLAAYDANIIKHWQQITAKRNIVEGHTLQLKYFQYLSLLFSEIYLDWYFNRREDLIQALNLALGDYQRELGKLAKTFQPFSEIDLNKIAFWSATGSGKTLLMHVNILQYLHYFKNEQHSRPEQIILLTPNEGLSLQHLQELNLSGFSAALFDKNQNGSNYSFSFDDVFVEIIDINKLGDKNGDKTVAVEHFSGNNLVLVDEGHRGSSGDEWLKRREALISDGFSFEYSATIGQAVNKSKTIDEQLGKGKNRVEWQALTFEQQKEHRRKAIFELYAKAVLFDYSYRYFYQDGYGKDSLILNLKEQKQDDHQPQYLTACLLAFYQQIFLFEKNKAALAEWNIEKPLWVFVGNKVADDDSDILAVVQFLAFFLENRPLVSQWLNDLVCNQARFLSGKDDVFYNRFRPLAEFAGKGDALYQDILHRLFNGEQGGRLNLTLLKKGNGELLLSVGESRQAFGIINIGDAAGLFKTAQSAVEFDCKTDEFTPSQFGNLNNADCALNMLIGSRKFTEGWSSYRVSTMGLLNLGRSEGSQIIQLFGRGVRLRGKDFSLKRSKKTLYQANRRLHLPVLETLNIFGIRANYMEQFQAYLQEEGIETEETLAIEFDAKPNLPKSVQLKTLKLNDEYKDNRAKGFKRQRNVALYQWTAEEKAKIKPIKISVDYYPRLEALASQGANINKSNYEVRHCGQLNHKAFAFFDWDKIYLALQQFKQEKSWFNLQVSKQGLKAFVEENQDWYEIFVPKTELEIHGFADVQKQQNWLIDLLCRYTEQFYKRKQALYEADYYELVDVNAEQGAMQVHYKFHSTAPEGLEYKERLEALKALIESQSLSEVMGWNHAHSPIEAICFDAHLFYPIMLLHKKDDLPLTMQPLMMQTESEQQFVRDLQAASNNGTLAKWTGGRDIYLLRNAANKSKGLGFAFAGNFYPDFLLWLVDRKSGQQWLSFIDPKGIRQMNLCDPKFGLANEVKALQAKLNLAVNLNAFVLSVTAFDDLLNLHLVDNPQQMLNDKNILFMDKQSHYLETMFHKILEA